MSKLILIALLLTTSNAHADAIALRHEVLNRLQLANVAHVCGAYDLKEKVIIVCQGKDKSATKAQYARVLQATEDMRPVVLDNGRVEVR